ncbi:hypothetical protein FNV43_RR23217 [Rhamnella rubrinervis]|uniref:CRIB domain-containing protein n=1 Tax=Rhamnella rubrinervis TaxID=2594499 RepID=A0A8K0DYH7_9ROSA|nr:hypothetical protein FNV43_RR23217 [Rhamnella rubrinervis]
MQIGHPTDVKHVAHIGWDGPSVNSPSWMTEFKPPEGFSSAPLGLTGDVKGNPNDVQWVSEDGNRRDSRASNARARDLPELPKSSRRQHSAGSAVESPTRGKSERTKQRRSSKNSNRDSTDSPKGPRPGRLSLDSSLAAASESPSRNLPDIPKKTRRKKSKDAYVGGSSSKQKPKAQSSSDQPEFISKSNDNELCQQQFDGEEKGFT